MVINPFFLATVLLVGGPCHNKWHKHPAGCLRLRVGEQYSFAELTADNKIAMVHRYEFTYVGGLVALAKYTGSEARKIAEQSCPWPADAAPPSLPDE